MAKQNEALETRLSVLEAKVDKLIADSKKSSKVRKVREYTDEQRAAIRARLLVGQEAARKRKENEAKIEPDKTDVTKTKKAKKTIEPVKTPNQDNQ